MNAETPATELTDAEVEALDAALSAGGYYDRRQRRFAVHAAVERILAARTKPVPSGDERVEQKWCGWGCGPGHTTDECTNTERQAKVRATPSPAPSGDEREALATAVCSADETVDMRYGLHIADAVLDAGLRWPVSSALSGAEAALELTEAERDDWHNAAMVGIAREAELEAALERVRALADMWNRRRGDRHPAYFDGLDRAADDLLRALAPSAGPDEAGARDE